jgi:hypothetical protein
MRWLNYPIYMRIIHVNSLSSIFLVDSPLYDATGSQIQIQITRRIWNRNHKYFRMWIRGSYGVDSWKKNKKSSVTVPLKHNNLYSFAHFQYTLYLYIWLEDKVFYCCHSTWKYLRKVDALCGCVSEYFTVNQITPPPPRLMSVCRKVIS